MLIPLGRGSELQEVVEELDALGGAVSRGGAGGKGGLGFIGSAGGAEVSDASLLVSAVSKPACKADKWKSEKKEIYFPMMLLPLTFLTFLIF